HDEAREYELALPTGEDDGGDSGSGQEGAGQEGAHQDGAGSGVRVVYRFAARRFALEHWVIEPDSLRCLRTGPDGVGHPAPVDVLDLVTQLRPLLGVPRDLLPVYLEELSATLAGAMAKRERELD